MVEVVRGALICTNGRTAEPVTLRAGWTQKNQMLTYFSGDEVRDTKGQRVLEFYFNSTGKLKCRKERIAITPPSILPRYGMVSEQTQYLDDLLGEHIFDTPKPVSMLADLVRWFAPSNGDLCVDFFAGSGTLAEAVIKVNTEDEVERPYLLCQLPEPIDNTQYRTLADVLRERVRLTIRRFGAAEGRDYGFRAFRLSASSFAVWDSTVATPESVSYQLVMQIEHIVEASTELAILTELLLKSGFPLTAEVEQVDFAGLNGFSVSNGALVVCLSGALTIESFEAMVELNPALILVLDKGFGGNDELKVNALQTVRARNQREGSDIALKVV